MDSKPAENFQQLILRLKSDKSYDTIERLAGGQPTGRSLQKLVSNGFTRMPDPETFQGLSRALNVSQRELVLAAARTLGIDIEAENPNDLVLVGAGRLPQRSQEALINMSRELQYLRESELTYREEFLRHEDMIRRINSGEFEHLNLMDPINFAPDENSVDRLGLAADKGQPGVDPEQLPED